MDAPTPPRNAREWVDREAARAERTGDMLKHMADAVRDQPQIGGQTYRADCIEALMHGAELAHQSKLNLLHVGHLYDRKAVDAQPAD